MITPDTKITYQDAIILEKGINDYRCSTQFLSPFLMVTFHSYLPTLGGLSNKKGDENDPVNHEYEECL